MAKKAALAPVPDEAATPGRTRREQVREDREARRGDIIGRWEERKVLRDLEGAIVNGDGPLNATALIDCLIERRPWTTYTRLLRVVQENVPAEVFLRVAATMLRVIELKEMPYADYLKTDEWRILASKTKKRYGQRCALDASHSADDAHHRTYHRLGREWLDDLIPLCRECHAKFHNKRP